MLLSHPEASIVVLGEAMLDIFVTGDVERISPEAWCRARRRAPPSSAPEDQIVGADVLRTAGGWVERIDGSRRRSSSGAPRRTEAE
jgi:bifunctional ADP-heptose synthase (sugar kinase/adenylyltransferase)